MRREPKTSTDYVPDGPVSVPIKWLDHYWTCTAETIDKQRRCSLAVFYMDSHCLFRAGDECEVTRPLPGNENKG